MIMVAALPAAADDKLPREQGLETPPFRFLLGGNLHNHAAYFGSSERKTGVAPVFALRLGRWQIANSGASALMGLGRESEGPGAATELGQFGPLRLGLGLRIDRGRKSADADSTAGLPDVRSTLRARLGASYAIDADWRVGGSLNLDALGRHGGSIYAADIAYRLYHGRYSRCSIGMQVQAGSSRYMRSYFGTPDYQPGAGLRDVAAGLSCNQLVTDHWVVFGTAGVGRLLGPAQRSPLTQQRDNYSLSVGLVWRSL